MSIKKFEADSSAGFTLIEILIALVVAGVGILAVLQLQGVFLQSASDSEKRSTAMSLAEKQVENLREFDALWTSVPGANSYYENIANNKNAVTIDNVEYIVNTSVQSFAIVSGALNAASSADSDIKQVTVDVHWDVANSSALPSCNSSSSCSALSTYIAAIDPSLTALAGNASAIVAGNSPTVSHAQGAAPDVIKIQVGNENYKETSKPLPDVSQHGKSTLVNFEVVTYKGDGNSVKQTVEDFVTVNCVCKYGNSISISSQPMPTRYKWDSDTQSRVVDGGETVQKLSAGVATSGPTGDSDQPEICTRCCGGHHDKLTAAELTAASMAEASYDPFRDPADVVSYAVDGSTYYDHQHYYDNGSTQVAVAPGSNSSYQEACRFKRIDGIYELISDWRQVAFNIMPYDALATSSAQSAYEEYIVQLVADYINDPDGTVDNFATSAVLSNYSASFPTSVAVPAGSSTQLMSRALYIDEVDAAQKADLTAASGAVSVLDDEWLATVPFYEVNTTLLSDWGTDPAVDSSDFDVTNEDIVTIVDPANDYYGTYSRGLAEAGSTPGTYPANGYSELSNTGLTSSVPIDPADGASLATSSIDFTISGSVITFSGKLTCVNGARSGDKCADSDYENVTIALTSTYPADVTSSSCSIYNAGGSLKWVYSCAISPNGVSTWTGSIDFTTIGYESFEVGVDAVSVSGAAFNAATEAWDISGLSGQSRLDVHIIKQSP